MGCLRVFYISVLLLISSCNKIDNNDTLLAGTWTNRFTTSGVLRVRTLTLATNGKYSFYYKEVHTGSSNISDLSNGIYTTTIKYITLKRLGGENIDNYRYEIAQQNGKLYLRLIGEGEKSGFYFK